MAKRLVVTFNDVITSTGFLDVTLTDVTSFIFTVPSLTGDVQITNAVDSQALEFFTRFNSYYNTLGEYETYVRDNVVYIVDVVDVAPIFDDSGTDIPQVSLLIESLEDYEDVYTIEYNDTENIIHNIGIKQNLFFGFSTVVSGSGILYRSSSEDINDSIVGSGFTIKLEADPELNFEGIYTGSEREYLVEYKRNSITLFNGWLVPEGFFESFVSDRWVTSIDCIDGLGFLEDLSYVDNNGLFFVGKQKELDIIVNCLNRSGIYQNINTNIDIYYEGLSTSLNILDNVYLNANRFVKDDGDTIMSCREVLLDVLRKYGATITSFEGEWYIYKLNQLFSEDTPTFFRYGSDGVALSPTTKVKDLSFSLGSHEGGFYPHHCNANQSISNKKSIGAYRISYKYGLVNSLLENTRLQKVLGVIDEWTINDPLVASGSSGGFGIDLENDNTFPLGATSDLVSLSSGDAITYSVTFKTVENSIVFRFKLVLTDGFDTYYLTRFGEWTMTDTFIALENSKSVSTAVFPDQLFVGTDAFLTFNIQSEALPLSGDLKIEYYASKIHAAAGESSGHVQVSESRLEPVQQDVLIKGEFHTVQRSSNPSAKVKDIEEVNVGDNPSDIYLGTISETDQTTATSLWFRKGVTESKPILRIMGEETLRLNSATSRVFSGDFYGYVPFLSINDINNITGKFFPISYSYDTKANITSIDFKQIYGDELTDIDYELTFDYGNTVKPTIKG